MENNVCNVYLWFGHGIFVYLSYSRNTSRVTKETFSSTITLPNFFLQFSTSLEVNEKHRDTFFLWWTQIHWKVGILLLLVNCPSGKESYSILEHRVLKSSSLRSDLSVHGALMLIYQLLREPTTTVEGDSCTIHSFVIFVKPKDNCRFCEASMLLPCILQKEMHQEKLHIFRRSIIVQSFRSLH
jgi:hypothetical protein